MAIRYRVPYTTTARLDDYKVVRRDSPWKTYLPHACDRLGEAPGYVAEFKCAVTELGEAKLVREDAIDRTGWGKETRSRSKVPCTPHQQSHDSLSASRGGI